MGVRRKLVFTFVRHGETDENAHKILQGSKHTPLNEAGREQARRLGVRLQREHESTSKGRIGSSTCTRAGTLQAQEPPFHFIFSSNNPRASETSEIVADQLSLPTPAPSSAPSPTWGQVVATPLLTERSLGAYEGRRSEQVLDEFGRLRWDHLPEPRMMGLWDIIAEESSSNQMGVESKFEFLSRAQRAIQFMIAHIVSYLTHFVSRNAIPEIRVLCVSHALFIRALLTQLLNIGTEWIMNVGSKEPTNFRWFACDIRNASVTRVQTEFVIYDAKRGRNDDEGTGGLIGGGEKKQESLKKKVRLMNPFLICLNDSSHCFLDFTAVSNA